MVRQQKKLGRAGETTVPRRDVLKLFEGMTKLDWPPDFTDLQRCLPVVAAYASCGDDFSLTLHSLTSRAMFNSLRDLAEPKGQCWRSGVGVPNVP